MALGLISLLLLVLAGLWLWRQFDEPLSAQSQAWLEPDRRVVADADDAYLAMLAFETTRPMSINEVAAIQMQLETIDQAALLASGDDYRPAFSRLTLREIDPSWAKLCPKAPASCLEAYLERRPYWGTQRQQHAQALVRYQALIGMSDFKDRSLLGPKAPNLPILPLLYAGELYDGLMIDVLEAGQDQRLIALWTADHRFWLRVADHSSNLSLTMLATARLSQSLRLLEEMLARRPALASVTGADLRTLLNTDARRKEWLVQALKGEVRRFSHVLSRTSTMNTLRSVAFAKQPWRGSFSEAIMLQALRLNQSINLAQKLQAQELARLGLGASVGDPKRLCRRVMERPTANAVGVVLACINALDLTEYHQKIEKLRERSRSILERLAAADARG